MKRDLLRSYDFKKDDVTFSIKVYSTAHDDSSQVVWVTMNDDFVACFNGRSAVSGIGSILSKLGFEGNLLGALFDGFFD